MTTQIEAGSGTDLVPSGKDEKSSPGLPLTIAGLVLSAAATASAAADSAPRLLPLSSEQVMAAGAAGTGCSWSTRRDGPTRFAAADDRAVVRLASGVVKLSPNRGARDLAPFTFDRWIGQGLTVRVVETGRARSRGGSVAESPAWLEIRAGGTLRRLNGVLSCGS